MNSLLQDLRYSFRMFGRSPAFAVTAILVLALGIGANTAMFSLLDGLLWSPRPFTRPAEIVQLYSQDKRNPRDFQLFSYPTYRDLAAHHEVFSGVFAHNLTMVGIGEGESTRRTFGAIVSSNYFSVLGVPLLRGHAFTAEDEVPSSNHAVAIVSYQYWKRTGFDPAVVGSTVRVNERRYTIIGVTPEHFTGTMMVFGPELYFPLGTYDLLANDLFKGGATRSLERRDAQPLFVVARLKEGITLPAAQAALKTIAANLEQAYPAEQKDRTFLVGPLPRLSTSVNPTSDSRMFVMAALLLGLAATVLLIACLNLANLLLARGYARRKEIAIRLALGGARRRIIRQLVTEGAVLSLLGGAAGLLLATWGTGLLVSSIATKVPMQLYFGGMTNPAVFAATFAFCGLATLAFALGPALRLTGSTSAEDLKAQPSDDMTARGRRHRWRPRHPLLVAQMGLSIALLITAGLFVRGALNAANVDTGFTADHLLVAEVDASLSGYNETRALQAYQAMNDRLRALPGVVASDVGAVIPLGMESMNREVRRAGIKVAPGAHPATAAEGRGFNANWNSVGTQYFAATGLSIIRGRAFTASECEQKGAPAVAIIDADLARELFPDSEPLGQRIQFGAGGLPAEKIEAAKATGMEIVGIVSPSRWQLFGGPRSGTIFVPFAQRFHSNANLHIRTATATSGDAAMINAVRGAIRAGAPAVPVFTVKTYAQHLDSSIDLWIVRTGARLFGLFGTLALILATIGIYGVKSYSVSRRTREIGIRVVLGANPASVCWMILREALATTMLGVAMGLLLGLALGQACAGMLYEVSARDPLTLTLAPLLLSLAALAACWLPARRATRVSPIVALRTE